MPTFHAGQLKETSSRIFAAAGATREESRIVAEALVEANLAGHDSHGIVRIPEYVRWMEQGLVTIGAHLQIVRESDSFAVVDGGWGFGQVVGREAMQVAIRKASNAGVGTVAARQCCHIGSGYVREHAWRRKIGCSLGRTRAPSLGQSHFSGHSEEWSHTDRCGHFY
jgi:hydroxycarboxylate dehydrogenase B